MEAYESESSESSPLMGGEPGSARSDWRMDGLGVNAGLVKGGEIVHKDSVYTYMVMIPEINRRIHGHYCTAEVCLATALFILTILLQLSLTILSGDHIFREQKAWKASLVQDSYEKTWSIDHLMRDVEGVRGLTVHKGLKGADHFPALEHLFGDGKAEDDLPCCVGPDCYGQGGVCCPPNGTTHAGDKDASLLSGLLRKPGGGAAGAGVGGAAKKKEEVDDVAEQWTTGPICTSSNQSLDCLPPSSQIVELWDRLDQDGDGMWTIEEARADAANIGCHVGVALEDVFHSACRGIMRDAADSSENGKRAPKVVPTVEKRIAMPRPYFEWWRGLASLCMYSDVALCGNMVLQGFFDGAMDPANNFTRGGVIDLDTAMSYCQRLLNPGGVCEAALPGSYVVYRSRVAEKCGAPSYQAGRRYTNPFEAHDVIATTAVMYSNLTVIELTHSPPFLFFMFLVIVLWYINLVDELKDIICLWDFIAHFDVDNTLSLPMKTMRRKLKNAGRSLACRSQELGNLVRNWSHSWRGRAPEAASRDPEAPEVDAQPEPVDSWLTDNIREEYIHDPHSLTPRSLEITAVARPHHLVCIVMAIVRSIVLFYLAWAGTEFMLMMRSYIDLILNALAIAFIFDLDEFLYIFLVPQQTKDRLDSLKPWRFYSSLPAGGWSQYLFAKAFWGLFLIPIFSLGYVLSHDWYSTQPVLEALRCACLHTGDRCLSMDPSQSWWADYWRNTAALV